MCAPPEVLGSQPKPALFLPALLSSLTGQQGEARMVDAFFWYSGFVFWLVATTVAACFIAADINDHWCIKRERLDT
jgi:hypothetical protein